MEVFSAPVVCSGLHSEAFSHNDGFVNEKVHIRNMNHIAEMLK